MQIGSEEIREYLCEWLKNVLDLHRDLSHRKEPLSLPAQHMMDRAWGAANAYRRVIELIDYYVDNEVEEEE